RVRLPAEAAGMATAMGRGVRQSMDLPTIEITEGGAAMTPNRFRRLCLVVLCAAFLGSMAHADILWEGDTALGRRAFAGVELAPGPFAGVDAPQGFLGPVFQMEVYDNPTRMKARCETRGCKTADGRNFRMARGGEYYIGWASLWDPLPTPRNRWCALFQIHGYGPGPGSGIPFVFRTLGDGLLHLQYESVNGGGWSHIWSVPLERGVWNTFVLHVKLSTSESDGFIELWYNGEQQTFINGDTVYP